MKKEKTFFQALSSNFIAGSLFGIIVLIALLIIIGSFVIIPLTIHFAGSEYRSIGTLILFSMVMNIGASMLELILKKIFSQKGRLSVILRLIFLAAALMVFALFLDWLIASLNLTLSSVLIVSVLLALMMQLNPTTDNHAEQS